MTSSQRRSSSSGSGPGSASSRLRLCWLGLMLWALPLQAQRSTFRQYGTREGLTNLAVRSALQDRAGYLWVGTDNGLFRYDGAGFRGSFLADGLPSTEIYGLAEAPDGTLWAISATGGVVRRRGSGFEPVEVGSGERLATSPGIGFDPSGRVYLVQAEGLVRGEPGPGGAYRFSVLVAGAVQGLWVQGDQVRFVRDGQLLKWTDRGPERIGAAAGLPSGAWKCLVEDRAGNLWVRSGERLFELPAGEGRVRDRSAGVPPFSKGACGLSADAAGRVYVPTDRGVAVVDGSGVSRMESATGFPADSSIFTFLDRDGSLWVGAFGQGLVRRLGGGEWLSWKREDGLRHNTVWAILRASSGVVWVGSTGGLDLLGPDDRVRASFTARQGLSGDGVDALLESPDGEVLAGTNPGGITRFSPEGRLLGRAGPESGLSLDPVESLALDAQGHLWAVGRGCFRSREPVARGRPLTFESVSIPGLPERSRVRHVLVDRRGTVWLSTSNGLARLGGQGWRLLAEADGLRSGNVAMVSEARDALWVSYRDPLGLTRLVEDGERLAATHHELPGRSSQVVYATAVGPDGRLWVSTDYGVYVGSEGAWRHYDSEDGVIWDDGDDQALHVDALGQAWLGTSNGLSRFTPGLAPAPVPPSAQLSSVASDGVSLEASEAPRLPYARRSLQLHFGALSFVFENRMRFRYRLVGQDDEWRETSEKSLQYATLVPGQYRFELLAGNPTGQWSSRPAELAFSVEAPWWQAWWFVTLASAALAGLGWALLRWRVKGIEAQKRLLERLVEDRTAETRAATRAKSEFLANMSHEIRTPMNAVIGMTELLSEMELPREARAALSTVRASGEALMAIINDILDFSKIESGKLRLEHRRFDVVQCVEEALAVAAAIGGAKGLELEDVIHADVPQRIESDPLRLRQILLNLLSNAVKFTERGGVRVTVRREPAEAGVLLHFEVRDSGIGIPEQAMGMLFKEFSQADPSTTRRFGGTGLGLAISKRLTEALGGRIWVESESGAGSTFHFTVRGEAPEPAAPVEPLQVTAVLVEQTGGAHEGLALRLGRLGVARLLTVAADPHWPAEVAGEPPRVVLCPSAWLEAKAGQEALRRLLAASPTARVVEVASARKEPRAPATAVVTRPFQTLALRAALGEPAAEEATPGLAPRPPAPVPPPLSILVAEDNPVNQLVITQLLRRLGHCAELAIDGEEVLRALRTRTYDVILMDVHMPRMDGLEATRRIRAGGSRTRILALTAGAFAEDQAECLKAGMDGFLAKPLRLQELRAALESPVGSPS
jgi:signal transduction histidine kinase/ligand-binding sensor domain-containing protein/CheY-like chemotaxis protein